MSADSPTPTLVARQLSRHYGPTLAVDAIDLELRRGEVLGLLGPNGAGKSTTMQMLTGNLAPSAGSISICGVDLLEQPQDAKAHIGYLPETPPLYRELSVDDYLAFCARLHRVPKADVKAAMDRAKARCGLGEVGQRLISHLSKGFQQRVGIAQAILHEPDVIILDEPTVGLDPHQIRDIRALIRELGNSHSVILSTHILPEVEAACDRVQILRHGRIVFADSIEGLKGSREGSSLLVGLSRPPALALLQGLPGVEEAAEVGRGVYRLRCAQTSSVETIARAALDNQWGLLHICPERASLEDVFVDLTREQPEAKP